MLLENGILLLLLLMMHHKHVWSYQQLSVLLSHYSVLCASSSDSPTNDSSATASNIHEKHPASYKTLLWLSSFTEPWERMIRNHLAQAAAGTFPKQTGKGNRQMRGAVEAGRHRSHRCDRAACNGQNRRAECLAGAVLQQGCRLPPSCHWPLGRAF